MTEEQKQYHREYKRRERREHPERTARNEAARYRKDKQKRNVANRKERLKRLYNLSIEQWEQIAAHQNGRCFGCDYVPRKNRLSVDHRHEDGLVRGLLCWNCNKCLAYLRDSPAVAKRLAEYLESPPAVAALGCEVFGRQGRVSRKQRRRRRRRRKRT